MNCTGNRAKESWGLELSDRLPTTGILVSLSYSSYLFVSARLDPEIPLESGYALAIPIREYRPFVNLLQMHHRAKFRA